MHAKKILDVLNQDFADLSNPISLYTNGPSQEDRTFLNLVETNVNLDDSHFSMPLPFKSVSDMPFNRFQAVKRAKNENESQTRKMLADPKYHSDYVTFVNDL